MCKALSYQKCARKMLMKLTQGYCKNFDNLRLYFYTWGQPLMTSQNFNYFLHSLPPIVTLLVFSTDVTKSLIPPPPLVTSFIDGTLSEN